MKRTTISVSYTHLDVYKRQRLNIGKIPLTSSELVKALFLKDSVRDKMSGRQEEISLPVSYTHLDVYKRQE